MIVKKAFCDQIWTNFELLTSKLSRYISTKQMSVIYGQAAIICHDLIKSWSIKIEKQFGL